VDCRTARAQMRDTSHLTDEQKQQLAVHVSSCAACRDDASDPIGHALAHTTMELALPSSGFTQQVIARLPHTSPAVLAQQAEARRRWHRILASVVAIGLLVAAMMVNQWAGLANTAVGVVAQALQQILSAAVWPVALMLVGAGILAIWLSAVMQRPNPYRVVGVAVTACLLLIATGTVTWLADRANATAPASRRSTLFQPIEIDHTIRGNVVSFSGDITVTGQVEGNVVSLLGDVRLEQGATVAGNVLAGNGNLQGEPAQVAGQVWHGAYGAALASGVIGAEARTLSTETVRGLTGLLAGIISFILAGLVLLLWPQRVIITSQTLYERPWVALLTGIAAFVLLVLMLLPVLGLLAITVAGLLLVPPLLLVFHLPFVHGLAAIGYTLGQRLTGTATASSALWGVAVQMVLVVGLGIWIPFVGLSLFYALASLGLGAYILSRRAII
jgi:hypothetical protein